MKLALILFKYGVRLDDPCCYPLGFMTISAILKRAGHDVTVVNQNIESRHICVKDFDVVLLTGFEEFLPKIKELSRVCKTAGVKTILGGALATFKPQEMLEYVDTVVVGEGDDVICQALYAYGIVKGTKPKLDTLPLPDYEGFNVREYHRRNGLKHMGVLTSRGCPYNCKFCASTCSYQCRTLSHVFDEIDLYKERYGATHIIFNDNTLNVSKARFMAICEGMKGKGLKWSAAIRVDIFDDEMAVAFKESGGEYFVVGVESFKQKKLDDMGKKITVDQIIKTLNILHAHGISYHGNILTGLPGETFDDIVNEVSTCPPGYNVFPVLVQPFIGTGYQDRSITKEQVSILGDAFKGYIRDKGMNCYPTLEAA